MKGINNQNLFSNHYLEELLPRENEWKTDVESSYKEIKDLFDSIHDELPSFNEDQLRKHFLDKVFEILGFIIDVETPAMGEGSVKKLDYAFFKDDETLKSARKQLKDNAYYNTSLCIGEAKRWGRPLDRKLKTEIDPHEVLNPSLQMSRYLWLTGVKWGVLTDGKFWRLYERESSKKLDVFYEIDLEELLSSGTVGDFKYFYLFYRADAFPAFLDKVYKGSIDYAKAVGDELKENVYKALKIISEGFLKAMAGPVHGLPEGGASENPVGAVHEPPEKKVIRELLLQEIHDNALILLYRLLFILYAEYRRLLPINENNLYTQSYSLDSLKREIAKKVDLNEAIPVSTFQYWNKLKELFEVINIGNKELVCPPYNGGLFSKEKHPFLEQYRLGDFYVASAINLLSRSSDGAYIDYGSLEIRHLGSIYEGLLEYKVKVAEQDLYPVKEKDKEYYIPFNVGAVHEPPENRAMHALSLPKNIKQNEIIKAGEIYLVTDKGERKATGSYYTPDYIVEYIVENTLRPVIADKRGRVEDELNRLRDRIRTVNADKKSDYQKEFDRKKNTLLIDEILSIKVLDPAMGSGHFLVGAVDFLAHELITAMNIEPFLGALLSTANEGKDTPATYQHNEIDEDDIRWARREVIEKCIFGVDLNPLAVELAKLSLWLHTVAKNRPLSFLDHHLRCGNSLIGAKIHDLLELPVLKKKNSPKSDYHQLSIFESVFKEKVDILLRSFAQIESLSSDTVEDVRQKEQLYREFRNTISMFQDVADVWTSVYFGNDVIYPQYQKIQDSLRKNPDEWDKLRQEPWFAKGKQIAQEKRFFHWEIEFPEIFFEAHNWKQNPGFDAVIGNPPYDVISELEQKRDVEFEKDYYSTNDVYIPAIGGKLNLYRFFSAISLSLLCKNSMHGFIVPMALLADKQAKPLREHILKKACFKKIEVFPQKDDPTNRIFPEAKLSTCIYILRKENPAVFSIRIHPGRDILETSTILYMTPKEVEEFDKENLSIPCYPTMTVRDLHLAIKLNKISQGVVLKDFAPSQQGEVNLTEHARFFTDDGKLVLRGAHVNRYEFQSEPKQGDPVYLDVEKFLHNHGENTKAYDHKYIRVGYQRGAAIDNWRRIIATIIERENFCSDTINYIVNPIEYDLFSILALLNSSLWEWRFRLTSTNNHVNSYEIDPMPMPPISFKTPERERKELVEEFKGIYHQYLDSVAMQTDSWQNDFKEKKNDRSRQKEATASPDKLAKEALGYQGTEKGVSGEDSGVGGKVHGVRERTGGYRPPEGPPKEKDGTKPLDSTRYLETSDGSKSYTEVSELLAVSVTKVIEGIVAQRPEDILVTSEWICKLHKDIAGSLFPDWAGRFRDINVQVGTLTPVPFYEVPMHVKLFCEDLGARLQYLKSDTNALAEMLAWVDWRFEWIHPFKDFNGRVGRILLTAISFKLKLPPFDTASVEPKEKEVYLQALRSADTGDLTSLTDIWLNRIIKALEK